MIKKAFYWDDVLSELAIVSTVAKQALPVEQMW